MLLVEDDVVFQSNFQALIGAVEVPEDWGIFDLGCAHSQRPECPELPLERLEGLIHSGALFARKFPKGADIGKLGLHRSIALAE